MSGILRNTLRLVGTAKYALNNSTKYLRSMTLTTNHLKNSLLSFNQANQISTNFGKIIRTTGKKILSLFSNEQIRKADIVHLKVLLSDGKVRLMTREREKNLIFPPIFSIELNEESIQPISNKISPKEESLSYSLGKWNISLDGDALTFKIDDTDETFILKHAVYVKAHINPPKPLKNGRWKMVSETTISDCEMGSAKIISKQAGLTDNVRSFAPRQTEASAEILKSYGNPISEALIDTKSPRIIDDKPNDFGRMKLKFPMTASLEGAPITIKMKDTDDT
ncbi:uncharacterized protein LOC122847892 [Aphidius gifuensis]|nr:uncharacterized protein LOC122847892 [Aphidius gifuensis]